MAPRKPVPQTDRQLLESLRDTLIAAINTARSASEDKQGQIAPLAKQLRDTMAAIAALPDTKQRDVVDEIEKRRAARLAGTPVRARAAGKVNGGTRSGGTGRKRGADPGSVAAASPRRSTNRGA